MFLYLLLSSIASGLIATFIMIGFLYLPLVWGGDYYDVMGAIGSVMTGETNGRSRFIGGVIYVAVGVVIAMLYGWVALALIQNNASLPQFVVFSGWPVTINLIYPLLGLAIGLGHGILVALLVTVVVIEHHPVERYRTRYILIVSQLIGHLVFGLSVMFFHSQFLQLLLRTTT